MKTQAVSNQNFTAGEIKFINKHFVMKPFDKISLYLPERIGAEQLETASKKIEGKDYDIFVYRSDNDLNMFEVRADKDYYSKTGQKPVFVHENVLQSLFSDAVQSAIDAYEEVTKIFL